MRSGASGRRRVRPGHRRTHSGVSRMRSGHRTKRLARARDGRSAAFDGEQRRSHRGDPAFCPSPQACGVASSARCGPASTRGVTLSPANARHSSATAAPSKACVRFARRHLEHRRRNQRAPSFAPQTHPRGRESALRAPRPQGRAPTSHPRDIRPSRPHQRCVALRVVAPAGSPCGIARLTSSHKHLASDVGHLATVRVQTSRICRLPPGIDRLPRSFAS